MWFIKCLSRSSSFGKALDPKDVSGHIDRHTRIFMDADTDKNRYIATLGFFFACVTVGVLIRLKLGSVILVSTMRWPRFTLGKAV